MFDRLAVVGSDGAAPSARDFGAYLIRIADRPQLIRLHSTREEVLTA